MIRAGGGKYGENENLFLATSLGACCCMLSSDQIFGGDRRDIHDAPAVVVGAGPRGGIRVPVVDQAPATPQVPTTKEVDTQPATPSNEPAISLAQFACHQPFTTDLSDPDVIHLFTLLNLKLKHVLRWRAADHGTGGLGIPGEYCTEDSQLRKNRRPVLFLVHKPAEEEANFYLVNLDGKRPKVVHNDPKIRRGRADPNNQKIASDFELTKNTLLSMVIKYGH
jgi:hypothetical protein